MSPQTPIGLTKSNSEIEQKKQSRSIETDSNHRQRHDDTGLRLTATVLSSTGVTLISPEESKRAEPKRGTRLFSSPSLSIGAIVAPIPVPLNHAGGLGQKIDNGRRY